MNIFTLLSLASLVALSQGHNHKRVDDSICPGAFPLNTTTVFASGADVTVQTLSCLVPLKDLVPLTGEVYSGNACYTTEYDIVCPDTAAPDESDCARVITAIYTMADAEAPDFTLPPGFVEQVTYGTCAVYFKNTAAGLMTNCWSSFAMQAAETVKWCLTALCSSADQIDGKPFWEVGIVKVDRT